MLSHVGNDNELRCVAFNKARFVEWGCFECALVDAITAPTENNHRKHRLAVDLLRSADRERLRAAGEPLPHNGPFTIFRGVAGEGLCRRVRGLSWTLDFKQAFWFANRSACSFNLANPAVYRAQVSADDVYFFDNDRNEQELVILPSRRLNVTIETADIPLTPIY